MPLEGVSSLTLRRGTLILPRANPIFSFPVAVVIGIAITSEQNRIERLVV